MSILTVMYNGASGISTLGSNMSVLADNVANVNSVAFKGSRMTFQEAITSAQGARGELGQGARVGTIDRSFETGQIESTDNATDVAISGRGFFMARDPAQTTDLYTRDGQFQLTLPDANGEMALATTGGYHVQGYDIDTAGTRSNAVNDITIRRQSLPKATSSVTAAVNLQNDPKLRETTDTPLYASWDGSNPTTPLPSGDFDYSTVIPANDDNGTPFDLTLYFDGTANQNEKEFLLTCDPSLDQRLTGTGATRYNAGPVPEKGAGALLYGKLSFTSSGDLAGIECWDVPPDGQLNPTAANQITLPRGTTDYSFAYNISGSGPNLTSTLNFGTEPKPQAVTSPAPAFAAGGAPISAQTGWDSVYDANGNQVRNGDVITFTGTDGNGNPATLAYPVNTANGLDDLLTQIGSTFNATATIVNGQLRVTDKTAGASQLAINAITYQSAAGATPLTDSSVAQVFGTQGEGFSTTPEEPSAPGAIATTCYASPSATLFQQQDGYKTGYLQDVSVGKDGIITASYTNGKRIDQAQLALADFPNLDGLSLLGGNLFTASAAAGTPRVGTPGEGSLGSVQGNALEMSNVDLGRQFTDLLITQRGFQANSQSISTANAMYQTALRLT
ncbi:MAG: flagellar hook-basal body complex protein [Desulfobacteraceae bacterium]|nr:flagellar hook-basal body complex protein [Desulfobacteraceae bacterium]